MIRVSNAQNEGILSEAQYSSTWVLCSHDVQLPQTCFSVGGPSNLSISPFFSNTTYGTGFNYIVTWNTTAPYIGRVTVSPESSILLLEGCKNAERGGLNLNLTKDFQAKTANKQGFVSSVVVSAEHHDPWPFFATSQLLPFRIAELVSQIQRGRSLLFKLKRLAQL